MISSRTLTRFRSQNLFSRVNPAASLCWSLRSYAQKPGTGKLWKKPRKLKTKREYDFLKNTKQFPESPAVLESKIHKVKKKYKKETSEEFQGVTMGEPTTENLLDPTERNLELSMEEQSALLKTLLRRSSREESKIAETFDGPIKKLLNPEMYEIFKNSFVPYEVSPAKIEQAEKFFTANPQLKHMIGTTEDLSKPKKMHQVSFAGRSNVGKSSLLSKLFGTDKKLVRVSGNPGFTQTVNYYELGATSWEHRSIYLIDMPGYGYAKASKSSIKQFQQLVVDFLNYPVSFQHRCFVLIDSRIGVGDLDRELMRHLEHCSVTYQIVLTKTDKISTKELQEQMLAAQQYLRRKEVTMGHPWIIATSATSGLGISELKACICLSTGILQAE